jgi:hypothetical protein
MKEPSEPVAEMTQPVCAVQEAPVDIANETKSDVQIPAEVTAGAETVKPCGDAPCVVPEVDQGPITSDTAANAEKQEGGNDAAILPETQESQSEAVSDSVPPQPVVTESPIDDEKSCEPIISSPSESSESNLPAVPAVATPSPAMSPVSPVSPPADWMDAIMTAAERYVPQNIPAPSVARFFFDEDDEDEQAKVVEKQQLEAQMKQEQENEKRAQQEADRLRKAAQVAEEQQRQEMLKRQQEEARAARYLITVSIV